MTKKSCTENNAIVNMLSNDAIVHDIERRSQMASVERTENELVSGLFGLLNEAIAHDVDCRVQLCDPYVSPVVIYLDKDQTQCLTGVTRNISTTGVGLVHSRPIACRELKIEILGDTQEPTLLYVKIESCESLCDGWYVSHGRFIDQFSSTGSATSA